MSQSLLHTARAWLAQGRPAVLVTVQATRGSVPREAGTRMLVAADAVAGTIGGGHLEWQAVAQARARLADGTASAVPVPQHFALGPSLGQCCGGTVTLHHQSLTEAALASWPAATPLWRLQLHGAGHVGAAIVRLLAGIDCQVDWVDSREDEALLGDWPPPDGLPPHIRPRVHDEPAAAVADAAPGDVYLVMTHRHDLDLAIVQAILARGDAGLVGLIGSATKRARFEHRLRARGVDGAALAALVCPIGVPGIPGKSPAVIAVAVVAQLLQWAATPAGQRAAMHAGRLAATPAARCAATPADGGSAAGA